MACARRRMTSATNSSASTSIACGRATVDNAVHPAFVRAASLPEPLRSHFPKSSKEAQSFEPLIHHRALSSRVLVVARTRVECAWAAYCDAVDGIDHRLEREGVLDYGSKLDESL